MKARVELNELINQMIQKMTTYNGKRWKRGYHNQIGVYDVKLNISQIQIIHEALRNVKYQKHLKKHWEDMYKEVIDDFNGRLGCNEEKIPIEEGSANV